MISLAPPPSRAKDLSSQRAGSVAPEVGRGLYEGENTLSITAPTPGKILLILDFVLVL